MNSKRLWATTAILFALSASGPNSSGVWAQTEQAVCSPGWEWVRFIYTPSLRKPKKETARGLVGAHMWIAFVLQNKNSLGQDPCLISNMLDAECRGIGEFAYSDRRDGLC